MVNSEELIVLVNLTESLWPSAMTDYEASDTAVSDLPSSPLNFTTTIVNEGGATAQAGPGALLCSMILGPSESDLDYYLNGVSTAIVIAMGVVGNLMAIIVLTRQTMKTSTNCFLSALAIWDTLVLLICLFLVTLQELSNTFKRHAFPYIVVYAYPVALSAQTATVWLTVSFTVERYIAVCHPLRAARMCNIPRARIVILVISVVSLLYNVPRWFEYTVVEFTDVNNNTCVFPSGTALANDSIYHKIYFGWLYFLVMCFIPLCTLAVFNSFLVRAVRRSQQQRKDMNVRQSRENNVTIMLMFVVMVFIICQVPALIYNMAYSINMVHVKDSFGWSILSSFRNFLVTLNSAINFILYCALGQKFRRTFVRTLCPCLAQKMPSRFQSFSFHPHGENGLNKSFNGNGEYTKMGYKPCRTEPRNDHRTPGLDMKVIVRPKQSSRESTDSNGSTGSPDTGISNPYQTSHKRLLVQSTKRK